MRPAFSDVDASPNPTSSMWPAIHQPLELGLRRKKFIDSAGNSAMRAGLSRLMTNVSTHIASPRPGLRRRLVVWASAFAALCVVIGTFAYAASTTAYAASSTAYASAPTASAANTTPSTNTGAAGHHAQADHVGQLVADSGASGIRLIEVRLGPDRVAERRSDLGSDASPRALRFLARGGRLVSEPGASGGSDREGIPPLYHLHAALLI